MLVNEQILVKQINTKTMHLVYILTSFHLTDHKKTLKTKIQIRNGHIHASHDFLTSKNFLQTLFIQHKYNNIISSISNVPKIPIFLTPPYFINIITRHFLFFFFTL
jgi:hypothetical protein